ncbi:amino acid adenylation domain-containing protein [Micromonospora foliorum]|uniref:amino acid adenylation domain-containing protein n=1 Tax=Micromonospora foliorum TaxID=2911210 RepID=UPI002378DD0D|nr:amino acid adenylation domain-containing protein [Micromonospora foliorum]
MSDAAVRNVVDLVHLQVRQNPDRPAVRGHTESMSYGQLWHRSGVLAAQLRDHGVRPGDVVGLCPRRSPDLVVGVLGILRAGGAYLPLDAAYPRQRLEYMLRQADATVLVGHRDSAEALAGSRVLIPLDETDDGRTVDVTPAVTAGDIGYVMFTSGSTGVPKGVMQTHGALANLVEWQLRDSVVGAGEVTAQFAPISFDVSFQEIFATLAAGGVLLCLTDDERRDPVLLWRVLARERVARLYLPFVMLQTLALFAEELAGGAPPLREVITAGEQLRCDDRIKRLFAQLPGCRLVNHYGPTETHVCTRYSLPADPEGWPLLPPIGTAIDRVRLHVLDAGGDPVPAGEPGELHVAGIAVAGGYLGQPELTAKRFRPEPGGAGIMYATGDVVQWNDGQLHYLGRNDDQVKVNGIRVEPAEIERALLAFPEVREAAVVARAGAGTRLVGFVTGRLDTGLIRERMAETLPGHLVPHRIVRLAELPTTPSGKLDRAALVDLASPSVGQRADGLAAIWQAELELADEQVEDLRAAGVDSLAAARVSARIARELGVLVATDRLLAATSLEHLAEIVAESPPVPRRAAVEPAGPQPVSVMQRQIFVDEMLADSGPSHWVLAELDITGAFDPAAAEAAVRALTRRHAALHTRYDFVGRTITQEYVPSALPDVTHAGSVDLAALRGRRLAERYEFGAVATPVVDLVRLGDQHHRMLFRLHHASCDGWSLGLLFEDFAALYRGDEPPHTIQPWQLPAAESDLSDWVEHLKPSAARPPMSWGRQRAPQPTLRRVPVVLDAAEVNAVRKRATDAGATPFAVLLAAWASLFAEDGAEVCVGVPISTRTTAEEASCVGLFLNTVLLPLATGAESLTALTDLTQQAVGRALRHRTAPLPDVLRRLRVDRSGRHHPVAQMMFALQPPGPREWQLAEGTRAELILDVGIPAPTRFDVVLNLDDRGNQIVGWLDHDAGAVDAAQVTDLIARWRLTIRA